MEKKKKKYERRKEVVDKTRNNNFAAALDYLKRQSGENMRQKDLAKMLEVSENTISNVLNYHTEVSEDIITQLQKKSGCVFNLQWLRGQSDVMLAADLPKAPAASPSADSRLLDTALAAKDDVIAALRAQLADTIAAKDEVIAAKDALIANLQQQLVTLRAQLTIEKGLSEEGGSFQSEIAEHQSHRHKNT